jgi:hypothetical protein
MEIIRDFWAFSEISKTIDIFYGFGNLPLDGGVRKFISFLSPAPADNTG